MPAGAGARSGTSRRHESLLNSPPTAPLPRVRRGCDTRRAAAAVTRPVMGLADGSTLAQRLDKPAPHVGSHSRSGSQSGRASNHTRLAVHGTAAAARTASVIAPLTHHSSRAVTGSTARRRRPRPKRTTRLAEHGSTRSTSRRSPAMRDAASDVHVEDGGADAGRNAREARRDPTGAGDDQPRIDHLAPQLLKHLPDAARRCCRDDRETGDTAGRESAAATLRPAMDARTGAIYMLTVVLLKSL